LHIAKNTKGMRAAMNHVRWGHGGRELEIHRWWCSASALAIEPGALVQDYEWAPVSFDGVSHARHFLQAHDDQVHKLRQMLAFDGAGDVSRQTDHQILDRVAARLAHREWVLAKKVLTEEAKQRYVPRGAPLPLAAASSAISPSSLKPRADDAPVVATEVIEPEFKPVDQDAQAATLRLAAVDGVPFCAVCEQARREREALTRLQEAA
jgi:hypothetical protein